MKKQWLSGSLATVVSLVYTGSPALALTINAGSTVNMDSVNGSAYTYTDPGDIIINGTLQGRDRVSTGGALTGNGGSIILTSSGGQIIIGPTGRIIINGTIVGGNGGTLILNASSITINGIIQANGLGAGGNGGSITINGSTLNLGSAANISALAGTNNNLGGSVTFNCSGLITMNSGSVVSTRGESDATHNLISMTGSGVNLGGQLNAQSRGITKGGTITIAASTGAVTITSSGSIIAAGNISNNGGNITLTGNVDNQGVINSAAGTGNATGGTISITGASTKHYTQTGGGKLLASGNSSAAASNGGSITINTGSVTVNNTVSGVTMDVSGSKLDTGTGHGGHIDIRATNGNLDLTKVDMRNYGSGGTIYLRSNTGDVNIGTGSYIYGFGDGAHRMDLIASTGNVNVNTNIGMDGIGVGHGGIINVSAAQNFNMSTDGYLSARGSFTNPSSGTDGGTITVNANNINLYGAAKMRTYGTQYQGAGIIGYGGVIDLNATNNYYSESGVILNAGGARSYTGPTITKNVIDISASTMTVDGRYLAHGRNAAQDGGRISFTANNALTLQPTASLEAWGDLHYGGRGGEIYLRSTTGNVSILNGARLTVAGVSGALGGLMNISAANNIALNAITLDASGLKGGTINVNAGNALSYAGSRFLANGITGLGGLIDLTSGGVMTVDNTATYDVSGTGGGVLSFTGTSVTNGGNVTATNGAVNMTATTGNVSNTGNLTSSTLQMTAGNGTVTSNAAHTGTVNATGRAVTLTNASGTFNVGDVSSTAGNTALTSTTGNMSIGAGKAVSASGTLTATASSGNIITNGALTGSSGGITLSAVNGSITGTQGSYSGALNATARSIGIASSSGSINLKNLSATSGTMSVSADNGGLTFTGGNTLSATGLMTLRAGTGSIAAGNTTNFTTTGLTFSVANDLTLNGTSASLSTASIDVYGDGGTSDAAGNVSITKTSGNLLVSRLNSSGTNLLAATGTGSTLTLANATTGGPSTLQADTSITATGGNNFGGAIEAYGNTGTADYVGTVNITSSDGTTDLNVTRLTATNATLTNTAGTAGVRLSNLEINNGLITMNGNGNMLLSSSTVNNTDTVRMTSVNDGDISLSNNTLTLVNGRTVQTTPTTGVYVDTAGNYALAGNTITSTFDVTTNGSVTMTSGSVAGTMKSTASTISMTTSSGNMAMSTSTATTGSMTLNAQAGNITNTGVLTSTSGNIDLTARDNIDTGASITANAGSLSMNSTNGDVIIDNTLTGGTGITVLANGTDGDITINAVNLNARAGSMGRDVILSASDDITFSGNADINTYGGTDQLGGNIQITAGGDFTMNNTGSRFNTYGLSDATHNRIEITAQNITTVGDFLARGQSTGNGGNGGYISLTATNGDVNLSQNTYLRAEGYTYSNTRSGSGGTINVSASRDVLMSGTMRVDSVNNGSQGLGGANDGGSISISAGRNALFTAYVTQQMNLSGASYASGTANGGDGGILGITAANNITFTNATGSTSPVYVYNIGGIGRGAGKTSGNGGTINFNYGGSLTRPNYNASQVWTTTDLRTSTGSSGATTGSNGHIYQNGVLTY
ncbi:MAG: beta strand repeat-containing protein [Candidatus Melainabacteria bacterium]